MNKDFITTIEIDPKEIHKNIDDVIFKKTCEIYEGKCFKEVMIKKVLSIKSRNNIVISRNTNPSLLSCDINFVAEYFSYTPGHLIGLVVTDIQFESIICKTKYYIAHINKNLFKEKKISIGNYFIGVIKNASHANGNTVAIIAVPYKKILKSQITVVNNSPSKENDKLLEATNNIVELIKKINIKGNINSKYKFPSYNINNFDVKEEGDMYFIISSANDLEESTFYIAPINAENLNVDSEPVKYTACISLNRMIYNYFASVLNYLQILDSFKYYDKNMMII